MSIITIVRETVEAVPVSPPLSFGHGPRDYENLRGDGDEFAQDGTGTASFPMAWVYPFVINDEIFQSGSMKHEYNLIVDFLQRVELDASEKELEAVIEEMFERSKQWLLIMKDDPRVKEMTLMRREPMYHIFDTNLCGYAVAVRVETEHQAFDYCLPEAKQEVCDVPFLTCAELQDLTDTQHQCIVPNITAQTILDNITPEQQVALEAGLCIPFINGKVFLSDGVTLVVELASGETFTIPKHSVFAPDNSLIEAKEFNEDTTLVRVYPYTQPSGQTSVFRTGDDGDIEATVIGPLRRSGWQNGLVDFFNLLNNNDFGIDTKRFTNTKGLTTYDDVGGGLTSDGSIADYFIDHYTGLAYFRVFQPNALFNAQIDAALAANFGGFVDWFLVNKPQFVSISKHHPGHIFQWGLVAPYPVPFDNNTNNRYTTSTTAAQNTPRYLGGRRDGILNLDTKTTTTGMGIYCRVHFVNA